MGYFSSLAEKGENIMDKHGLTELMVVFADGSVSPDDAALKQNAAVSGDEQLCQK